MLPSAVLPHPFHHEHLCHGGPVKVVVQLGACHQRALFLPSVSIVVHDRLAHVLFRQAGSVQGAVSAMGTQRGDVVQQGWLVGLDEDKVITACVHDLLTQAALAGQGIPREHASLPVEAGNQRGGGGKFRSGFVTGSAHG